MIYNQTIFTTSWPQCSIKFWTHVQNHFISASRTKFYSYCQLNIN